MSLNVTNSSSAVGLANVQFDELGALYDDPSSPPWSLNRSLMELSLDAFCCPLFPGNDSRGAYWQTRRNVTAYLTTYEALRAKLNNVITPFICMFGLIGNSFSIYVFSRRWLTKYIDQLERSASTGLVSLALSDLSFCLVSIPAFFLRTSSRPVENNAWNLLALYYGNYRSPLTNLFLLNSTWIIVVISIERFVAVSHAIRARWLIRVRVTVIVHSTVFLASFVLCMPLMLRNRIQTRVCPNDLVCHYVETWRPLNDENFRFAYKVVWTTVGTFVPLILLVATSVRLLVDLYRSSRAFGGLTDPDRYGTTQITTMVAAILLTFVALVCPSMVFECLGWFWFSRRGGSHSPEGDFRFWQAMLVTNLLESIKFSSNFLLYCAVSREFRKNFDFRRLKDSLTAHARPNRKRPTSQRITDGSTASACQLTVIQPQSRATGQEGKEFTKYT